MNKNKTKVLLLGGLLIFGLSAKRAADDPRFAPVDSVKMFGCIQNAEENSCTSQEYDVARMWLLRTGANAVYAALSVAGFDIDLAEVRRLEELLRFMAPVPVSKRITKGARQQQKYNTLTLSLNRKVPLEKLSEMMLYLNSLSNQLNHGTLLKLEELSMEHRYVKGGRIPSASINIVVLQNSAGTKKIVIEKLPNNTITYTFSTPGSKKEFTHSMYLNNEIAENMQKEKGF